MVVSTLRGLRVLRVQTGQLVLLDRRVFLALPDPQALPGRKGLLGLMEVTEQPDRKARKATPDLSGRRDRPDLRGKQELQALLVLLGQLDLPATPDQQARLEPLVRQAIRDQPVRQALPDPQAPQVQQVMWVQLALLARLDQLALLAQRELPETPDPKDQPERRGTREPLGIQGQPVLPVLRERRERRVQRDRQALQVRQALQAQRVHPEPPARPDLKDQRVPPAR